MSVYVTVNEPPNENKILSIGILLTFKFTIPITRNIGIAVCTPGALHGIWFSLFIDSNDDGTVNEHTTKVVVEMIGQAFYTISVLRGGDSWTRTPVSKIVINQTQFNELTGRINGLFKLADADFNYQDHAIVDPFQRAAVVYPIEEFRF